MTRAIRLSAGILLALMLGACAMFPSGQTATAVPSTATVTGTPVDTATAAPTPAPTWTPAASPSPTPTVSATPTPGPTATPDLAVAPGTRDELARWLAYAWNAGATVSDAMAILEQAKWTAANRAVPFGSYYDRGTPKSYPGWLALDMNGDGTKEWVITVFLGEGKDPCDNSVQWRYGEIWLVNDEGIAPLLTYTLKGGAPPPVLVSQADLTGDGLPDLVTEDFYCGMHTATASYNVISGHGGRIRSVVEESALFRAAFELRSEGWRLYDRWSSIPGIVIVSPRKREVVTTSRPSLILTGGWFASIGAGPHRAFTETWAWNGTAFVMADIQPREDGSDVMDRIHMLYDANFALALGKTAAAVQSYQRVVLDETLDNEVYWPYTSSYDDARRFAAFRLLVLSLDEADQAGAGKWRDWLLTNYPQGAYGDAVDVLMSNWQTSHDMVRSCTAVASFLKTQKNPTGSLSYTGYANPQLGPDDVCPASVFLQPEPGPHSPWQGEAQ